MKELKYQKELEKLDCDFSEFSEVNYNEVFRWVFESCNEKSFLPVYYNNHTRAKNEKNCKGWALSFFDTKENAKNRLLKIARHRKKIFKKLGTHIAQGTISTKDGISNTPNSYGHFDTFEYKNVNLSSKFEVIEVIYDGKN